MQTLRQGITLKKLRGGLIFGVGWLLSPLCWWNDLIFNLPIAYGVGYLCGLLSQDWVWVGMIAGYWLSNLVGLLLMQAGAVEVFQAQPQDRNLKKELLLGLVTSTVFTVAIVALVQLKLFDVPLPFAAETLHPGLLLSSTTVGR